MPIKWLDNVLSHNRVAGVAQERQGISRRLTVAVAEHLARNEGRYFTRQGLSFAIDLPSFRAQLLERLENAVEVAPVPRRGRPPKNKTGRLD